MAVGLLRRQQRLGGAGDRGVERAASPVHARARSAASRSADRVCCTVHRDRVPSFSALVHRSAQATRRPSPDGTRRRRPVRHLLRGGKAGADSALDRRRQAGIGVVAGKQQVAPARRRRRPAPQLLRAGEKRRPPLLDDARRRHRRPPAADRPAPRRATASARSASAGRSTIRSAALTVTDNTSRLRKIHSAVPPITPTNSGEPAGADAAEMGVDDRRKGIGHGQRRHQPGGDRRRHRQNQPIVVAECRPSRRRTPAPPPDPGQNSVRAAGRQSGSRRLARARSRAPDRQRSRTALRAAPAAGTPLRRGRASRQGSARTAGQRRARRRCSARRRRAAPTAGGTAGASRSSASATVADGPAQRSASAPR